MLICVVNISAFPANTGKEHIYGNNVPGLFDTCSIASYNKDGFLCPLKKRGAYRTTAQRQLKEHGPG